MTSLNLKDKLLSSLGFDTHTLLMLLLFALLPTFVVVFLLKETRDKYELELTEILDTTESHALIYYVHLKSEAEPIEVKVSDFNGYLACCQICNNESSITHQSNFYGHLPVQSNTNLPIFCDVTGDGADDMFVFSQKADSIFINGIDLVTKEILCYGRFIAVIGEGGQEMPDYVLRPIMNYDKNHDGIKEFYFLINAGFALTPRKIFSYDYANDHLDATLPIGGQHYVTPFYSSPDSVCLVSTTLSTNNYGDRSCDYSDSCAWLIYYDMDLEICKPVHSVNGTGSRFCGPYRVNEKIYFLVTNAGQGKRSNYFVELNQENHHIERCGASLRGNQSRISDVRNKGILHYLVSMKESGISKNYEIDFEASKIHLTRFSESLPQREIVSCQVGDRSAYLSKDPVSGNALLLMDDLKHEVSFSRPLDIRSYCLYFQAKKENGVTVVHVKGRDHLYTYVLRKTKLYGVRYVIWLAIYLLSLFFVFLIGFFYQRRIEKQIKLRDQITEMQMKLLNSQLAPHFTCNALNMISAKVLTDDKYEAYDLISHFSAFMRSALLNTHKSSWSIDDELSFLQHYRIIMQNRVLEMFDYELDNRLSDELLRQLIPRLIIQNAVENSIKYAFNHTEEKGVIRISLFEAKGDLVMTITDNGIGIENSKRTKSSDATSTGQGLLMSQQQVKVYNRMHNASLSYKVEQLGDGANTQGTKVTIILPL